MADRYRLTQAAARDIEQIARHTQRQWGKAQRRRYLRQIEARLGDLVGNPNLGLSRHEILKGLRSARVGRHAIFYRADRNGILAARILHESMDIDRHLGEATEDS